MTLSIRNYIFMITLLLNASFANSKNVNNDFDLWSNDFLPPLIMTEYMGTKVGNGGISVVCDSKRYFLDYFYYQTKYNWNKNFEKFGLLSHEEIITELLNKYSNVDKTFAQNLLFYSLGFLNDLKYNVILRDTQQEFLFTDYSTVNIYNICSYDQIIFHNYSYGTHYYSLNLKAFYEMDRINQVVAVLHESLYFKVNFNNKGITKEKLNWILSEMIFIILDSLDLDENNINIDKLSDLKQRHYSLIKKYSKYLTLR